MDLFLVFSAFGLLAAGTYRDPSARASFFARGRREWIVDALSLGAQGFLVPLLKLALMSLVWPRIFPGLGGAVRLSFAGAFLLNFTLIDYLYYWNHRLLHHPRLWRWHAVHHTSERLDFAVTSRNSLLTHFLILYLWVLSLLGFLLADPRGLWWGAALSAALDLWRHSGWVSPAWLRRGAGFWLILPEDHEWHHGRDVAGVNFGANLKLWDRLHGTAGRARGRCPVLGNPIAGDWRSWLFPAAPASPTAPVTAIAATGAKENA